MAIEKVNISQKLSTFGEHWSPKLVGEVDDFAVKVVKLQGEFIWHHHHNEDELFWVIQGQLKILLREGEVVLNPGEFVIIPKGVEHKPVADEEVHVVLFERNTTLNTGNVQNERTVNNIAKI
jgi:mannose-6-phosphate isomerase-like protein (cupin superfamily)